ncbi:MAG: hypothetical protein LC791_16830 [Acidobacteria bacterium]|nr:hypothetical protein [Acidobacteriota bacterium]
MPRSVQNPRDTSTFDEACARIERALDSGLRQNIVADVAQGATFGQALLRLREGLRSNIFKAVVPSINLASFVSSYDSRTRQEGFHVLHDWDGKADKVNPDIIPVDVLHYLIDRRGDETPDSRALAILLDYYFMHVLALLSVRVWDDGDADDNLDRLDALLRALQGPDGGGQPFAADAETLLLIGTSHFELEERGYATLLEKVRTLNRAHRLKIAIGHASSMGSHLRFGFDATYARDTVTMRGDNVADYPWLCFALATVMEAYARGREERASSEETRPLVEALLNGLSADARAFVGDHPPASLSSTAVERSQFRDSFQAHRRDLVPAFEQFRPSEDAYSPLAFFFNFSHNVVKGTVVDALMWGEPWPLTFNDLLTGLPLAGAKGEAKEKLARTVMAYALSHPDRIRGRPTPVIVYDPVAGRRAFATTMRRLDE